MTPRQNNSLQVRKFFHERSEQPISFWGLNGDFPPH